MKASANSRFEDNAAKIAEGKDDLALGKASVAILLDDAGGGCIFSA